MALNAPYFVDIAVPEPGTVGLRFGGICAPLLRRERRAQATEEGHDR